MDFLAAKLSEGAQSAFLVIGLRAYWPQFPGLKERLEGYYRHIADQLSESSPTSWAVGWWRRCRKHTRPVTSWPPPTWTC
ncbi:MAG: hypothetical protein R2856_32200 [Caldilineaceae bacterium]